MSRPLRYVSEKLFHVQVISWFVTNQIWSSRNGTLRWLNRPLSCPNNAPIRMLQILLFVTSEKAYERHVLQTVGNAVVVKSSGISAYWLLKASTVAEAAQPHSTLTVEELITNSIAPSRADQIEEDLEVNRDGEGADGRPIVLTTYEMLKQANLPFQVLTGSQPLPRAAFKTVQLRFNKLTRC